MNKFCLIFTLFISLSKSQIAYPEENSSDNNQNAKGREPVYIPGVCPINQWYWPGDQETDWVCDCATRFVYQPSTDMCHELYRQGPCQNNEYLILLKDQIIPECVSNSCMNDTMVPFNGKCHLLYKSDACPSVAKLVRTLNVNPISLELECSLGNSVALNSAVHVKSLACLPGSKRSATGKCRIIAG